MSCRRMACSALAFGLTRRFSSLSRMVRREGDACQSRSRGVENGAHFAGKFDGNGLNQVFVGVSFLTTVGVVFVEPFVNCRIRLRKRLECKDIGHPSHRGST